MISDQSLLLSTIVLNDINVIYYFYNKAASQVEVRPLV